MAAAGSLVHNRNFLDVPRISSGPNTDAQDGSQYSGTQAGESAEEHIALLFDVCRGEDGKASIKTFFEEVGKMGIRQTDPRLKNMIRMLEKLSTSGDLEKLRLEAQTFRAVMNENIVLITTAFQNRMVIPAFEAFCDTITKIYHKCKENREGEISSTLPQISEVDETIFGITVCTIDGQRFSIGDVEEAFCMHSMCKPITYGLTLSELSVDEVHKYQGREPSGRKMDDIALDFNCKPFNPLINSGALLSASLLLQKVKPELDDLARKYEFIYNVFEKMAGGETLQFNNSTYLAQKTCADRDFALAYFLRENGCFPPGADIKKILDLYFQLSSLEMTCESNSVMAATLANNGTCPISGERVMKHDAVNHVLALMYSCGMSIYSGQFAFNIGLPAMSSSTGGLMLVVPNVMGISIYSPPLDKVRNSVRGVQFCQELINCYEFHRFDRVGDFTDKIDPTLKKSYSTNELGIQLLFAAASGDIAALKRAYLRDVDLNMSDYDGRSALHLCAAENHFDCVKFLLEIAQVSPDPTDRWNNTPLSEALRFKHIELANYLKAFIREHPSQSHDPRGENASNSEGSDEGKVNQSNSYLEVQVNGNGDMNGWHGVPSFRPNGTRRSDL